MQKYQPQMKATHWEQIRAFVHEAVSVAAPHTAYSERLLLTPVSAFALWAWRDAALPLDQEVLFSREVIEHFVRTNPRKLRPSALRNYRTMLLRMAEALLPDEQPAAMRPLNDRAGVPPYSTDEVESLQSWALGQGTELKRRKGALMLSLCAGAGLRSTEIAALNRSHILIDDQGIVIRVGSREVPLLASWESWLQAGLKDVSDDDSVFGRPVRKQSKNLLSGFVETTTGDLKPRSDRLRATWLVTHLRAGTPMKALMAAAGIAKFENLSRYLSYVPTLGTVEYRQHLQLRKVS
ncbi:tyrosine-type recombinase/integrase [Homoserinimonas sp. OAct 916]|uniref:tyrosine-type recombinase/integrase n=1 Tax=Homoserinimonas sp. OAct 916 TaxID=2211450 RepID=UPI000DBE8F48|nr:tyrosine-type recombinase/integrase [Homoserinimonas sp. OAct 916]